MASEYSSLWRRGFMKCFPFLFNVCPEGNWHWAWCKFCYCRVNQYGHDWNGGVYNLKEYTAEKIRAYTRSCLNTARDKIKNLEKEAPKDKGKIRFWRGRLNAFETIEVSIKMELQVENTKERM